MRAFQAVRIMLFEPSKDAVGKASKGLRAIAVKSFFQDS